MGMLDTIRARRDEVYAIAKRHKAEKLWFFGSCARGYATSREPYFSYAERKAFVAL